MVEFELNEYQIKKVQADLDKALEQSSIGIPGIVIGQVQTTRLGKTKCRCKFIPNEQAKRIVAIIQEVSCEE